MQQLKRQPKMVYLKLKRHFFKIAALVILSVILKYHCSFPSSESLIGVDINKENKLSVEAIVNGDQHRSSQICSADTKQQFASLCSCKADGRGLHQNVIAYSLYGNLSEPNIFRRYVDPIKSTLDTVKRVYPDWIVRIYMESHKDAINLKMNEILDVYPFVDLCNVTNVLEVHGLSSRPIFQRTWRFLPLLDPSVDRLMSRDSDSLVLNREVDAVQQWLTQSNATFHIMRDNKRHNIEMLAGLWGAKICQRRVPIKDAAMQLFKNVEHKLLDKKFDQVLLKEYIWPLAINDKLAHDSYLCHKYPGSNPFPTQRQGPAFVGQVVRRNMSVNNKPEICPANCRPKNHQDWIYC